MKEQLISFETAKLAKNKGFNIPVANCYNENGEIGDLEYHNFLLNFNSSSQIAGSNTNLYSAPTQSLLQKWLREVYKEDIFVIQSEHKYYPINNGVGLDMETFTLLLTQYDWVRFNAYEEALEHGLLVCLQRLK